MIGGILTDVSIKRAITDGEIVIDPWDEKMLNPCSVDLTLGSTYLVYDMLNLGHWASERRILDAKQNNTVIKDTIRSNGMVLQPGVGYLMHTRERVHTSKYVPVMDGKSSLGRLFLKIHATAGYGDPGFNGQYTLEVESTYPLIVYPGMRIAQIRFHTMCGPLGRAYEGNYKGEAAMGPVASRSWNQFGEVPPEVPTPKAKEKWGLFVMPHMNMKTGDHEIGQWLIGHGGGLWSGTRAEAHAKVAELSEVAAPEWEARRLPAEIT